MTSIRPSHTPPTPHRPRLLPHLLPHLPPKPLLIAQDLRLLSIMLRAHISLQDALLTLSHTSQNTALSSAYKQILAQLQAGVSLPKAIEPYAHIFSPMGIALLHSGAQSSELDSIVEILARYFQTIAKNRANFLKALFYPIFVLLGIAVAFIIIALFVIPEFSALFASFDTVLPLSTRTLIAVSSLVQEFWWGLGLAGLALLYVGVVSVRKKNALYTATLGLLLRAPLLGRLLLYRELWGYFLGFFYLYQAHIDFDTSLPIALQSVQNPTLQRALSISCERVARGDALDRAFASCAYIDTTLQSFLATAQKSGELECILELCAQYCHDMYEQQIARILALIEPFSTIIIALFVSWLAFGIFLPIWELGGISL